MPSQRLQKIIAAAGVASRRKAEQLIASGMVSVNGTTITEMGAKADPETDHIKVGGKLLRGPQQHVHIMLNKPKGYVTTVSDPEKRPTVMSLLRRESTRLYPVGRLDYASEGLLLMTNDGELAHRLTQASSHVPKTYLVKVSGEPDEGSLEKLRSGISIAEKRNASRRTRTAPAKVRLIKEAANPWFEITLIEGKNRQIRKMFEEIGHRVEKIRRVRYGPLVLDVPPGESRRLTPEEVRRLRSSSERGPSRTAPASKTASGPKTASPKARRARARKS